MKISRVVKDKSELWMLLGSIRTLDEHTFVACLLGAYMGARFRELEKLKTSEFRKSHVHLGTQIYKGTGRRVLVSEELRSHLQNFLDRKDPDSRILEKADGTYLSWLEASQIVKQSAEVLGLECIAISSFRKSFGNRLIQKCSDVELVSDNLGFFRKTNLQTMFHLKLKG